MRISIEEAKRIIEENKCERKCEKVALSEALGRTLAKDVAASFSQPPFRRSAMDGYAIRQADFAPGKSLVVDTEVDAGDTRVFSIKEKTAVRIMTGARVPEGADMVVPQELTDYGEAEVSIAELPKRSNIGDVGEDFKEGDILAKKDTVVTASIISALTAAGVTEVECISKIRVTVLTTGDELQAPGTKLLSGHIYDSNSAYLKARLAELDCELVSSMMEGDDLEKIVMDMEAAMKNSDYIITFGGVSVGKKDLLEEAITRLGASVLFHGIAVKPGMPTMFSVKDGVSILSLSGNPYSAAAVFEYFFPYNRRLTLSAVLKEPYENKHDITRLVKGYFDGKEVALASNQKNGSVHSDIRTNCLAEIPAHFRPDQIGEPVVIHLLNL